MIPFGQDENVKIDQAHAELLKSLVMANKPKDVLELGIGGGVSCDAILSGLEYNQQPYNFTIVDNWFDWHGQEPAGVREKYGQKAEIITSSEQEFVFGCKKTFDFIMSDADHFRADQWFEYVYANLLNNNGILVYHDVNIIEHDFDNLRRILYRCQELNLPHKLFNLNSLPTERCQRGLLVIFKSINTLQGP